MIEIFWHLVWALRRPVQPSWKSQSLLEVGWDAWCLLCPRNICLCSHLQEKEEYPYDPPKFAHHHPSSWPPCTLSGPYSWLKALLACPSFIYQVKIAYQNLCLHQTHLLNLESSLQILLSPPHFHWLPSHYLWIQCVALTSRHSLHSQIHLQRPDSAAK